MIVDCFAGGGGASTGTPKKRRTREVLKHGLSYTPEYRAWQTARLRCIEPTNQAWPSYGGRGIRMCERWLNSASAFVADMGPKPSPKHELDRRDNDGHYEPGNCRWVLRTTNDRNRRSNRLVTFNGETHAMAEWCERFGLPQDTATWRLRNGWTPEATFTTPVRAKKPNGTHPRYRANTHQRQEQAA